MNISIIQRRETLFKNGTSPLYLRFTHERKKKLVSLGISLLPNHWDNDNQRISSEHSDCGNSSNTIATKLSVFKAIYNHAINENIFQPKDNPFIKIKVGKYWKDTRKRAITKDDVIRLKELDLTKDANTPYLELARDIFLFSYYTAGINFKDIATLKVGNIENNYLYYVRHKTSKKITCPILNESKAIMAKYRTDNADDYIFPILDKNIHLTEQQIYNRVHKVLTKINLSLKLLSTQLGLKYHLTTYVARHTYATVLKNSGVSVALISEALGHSDLATTQIYLDSFELWQVEEAMNCLL